MHGTALHQSLHSAAAAGDATTEGGGDGDGGGGDGDIVGGSEVSDGGGDGAGDGGGDGDGDGTGSAPGVQTNSPSSRHLEMSAFQRHLILPRLSSEYALSQSVASVAMFLTLLHFVNESNGAGEPAPRSVRPPQVVATTVGVRRATSAAREIFIAK